MKLYEKKSHSGKSLMVAIPKDITIFLGLKKGDNMIVTLDTKTNTILIKKDYKE